MLANELSSRIRFSPEGTLFLSGVYETLIRMTARITLRMKFFAKHYQDRIFSSHAIDFEPTTLLIRTLLTVFSWSVARQMPAAKEPEHSQRHLRHQEPARQLLHG